MEICNCREYRFPKDARKNERVCDVMNATVGMSSLFLLHPPGGLLLITWKLRLKGGPFSGFKSMKGYQFH